ncbi:helicase-associated domain-containing protein [uncultured Treponema sp.]|uniref:helicase-associated domain-containing protein n=1 Tax=uncultured Treponema sp. TaxID=162155 RepID=UPI0025F2CB6C|nr:helicase-associated domain-containing protein [uncultured Treponema sp.]
MQLDPKVQRIIDWRESIAVLPDNHFFEIIRMYLGEIKTPFNKQKLIEELGAFIRREENRRTLISLLSETDLRIITAVKYISSATQEKLYSFFAGTYTFAQLYERLLNLEERLILYRKSDRSGKTIVLINPHLEEDLEPYTKQSVLLESPEYAGLSYEEPASLSPELIAAYISFIHKNHDLCKADGSFKKRTESEIERLFPGKTDMLFNLTKAFINLSLLREAGEGYEIDKNKFLAFARLDERLQYAYFCVASAGRFSRSSLVRQAKLLLDVATSVPHEGFSRSIILRLAYLISEDQSDGTGIPAMGTSSRFSAILNRARASQGEVEQDSAIIEHDSDLSSILDRLIECASLFGIFSKKGIDIHGESIFVPGAIFDDVERFEETPKCLSVDAGFNVTLMPGLPLENLIPLMDFMELKTFDTAAVFEINRKSIMRGFDAGLSANRIFSLLKKYSPYEIPQNLEICVDDWSRSYSSATIFKGYVLQVSSEKASITENNPAIAPFIAAKLATGIYLLSVESDEQAQAIIARSGLDFIGKIKTPEKTYESIGFPEFVVPQKTDRFDTSEEPAPTSDEERAAHFEAMRAELEKLNLPPEKKEGLAQRIQHKIILSPAQLRADSVKFERIEAGGMDFSGKLHIVEGSISNNSMVELQFDDRVIVGVPLSITKTGTDATVLMEVMPDREEKVLSIGQAKFVKRIRGSVLR